MGRYTEEYYNADPSLKPLSLAGRVPVKVVLEPGQAISNGNFIVPAGEDGYGKIASGPSVSVGKAIQNFDPAQLTCGTASDMSSVVWPYDDGTNPALPCFQLDDGRFVGKVMIYVETAFYSGIDPILEAMIDDYDNGLLGGSDSWSVTDSGLSTAQDVYTGDLYAQAGEFLSLSSQSLDIGSGAFLVDASGNATITGDLEVDTIRSTVLGTNVVIEGGIDTEVLNATDVSATNINLEAATITSALGDGVNTLDSVTISSEVIELVGEVRTDNVVAQSLSTGELVLTDSAPESKSSGREVIVAGDITLEIESTLIKADSIIVITPRVTVNGERVAVWLDETVDGSFTVSIETASLDDVEFDWFVVN